MSEKNCVTHYACDCIQEKLQHLEDALKGIKVLVQELPRKERLNYSDSIIRLVEHIKNIDMKTIPSPKVR